MLARVSQFFGQFSRRQLAIAGGLAAGGVLAVGVISAVLITGGSGREEVLRDPCSSPFLDDEDCEEPSSRARTRSPSASPSGSVTPTPTPSPKPTPTTDIVLPTNPPTAAPTAPPPSVTAPPAPAAKPQPDSYVTIPYLSDTYLGSIGAVIEFAVMPGASNTGIVASQNGKIYKVSLNGASPPQLWGDISGKLSYGGEEGLLSVAFSPGFPGDGRVYVYYTTGSPGPNILARYSATTSSMHNGSEKVLLSIPDFAVNHNGGHIAFDSAGLLYLSTGDGGGAGDPEENGQDLTSLLGKVLRLNVSGGTYTIPPDNPFTNRPDPIRKEIFAYGFRNPWRMTIDPATGNIWLGDVGQSTWEEVDQVVSGGNYGWDCYEGLHVYESSGCSGSGYRAPRHEYDHSFGRSVTGGVVYRGSALPELKGWYVFADFYSGRIWAVNTADNSGSVQLTQVPYNISSFTLLPDDEIAIVSYENGVYKLSR